jgi:hypothetical protein
MTNLYKYLKMGILPKRHPYLYLGKNTDKEVGNYKYLIIPFFRLHVCHRTASGV